MQLFFLFDEKYAATARVLYPTGLVIRCPIWPLSVVEKVPNCASLVRLSVVAWDQCFVSMPVFRSFLQLLVEPIITSDKKANAMVGASRLRQNGVMMEFTLYDMK